VLGRGPEKPEGQHQGVVSRNGKLGVQYQGNQCKKTREKRQVLKIIEKGAKKKSALRSVTAGITEKPSDYLVGKKKPLGVSLTTKGGTETEGRQSTAK